MKKGGALSSIVGALKRCFELKCQMQIFLYNLLNSDVFRYFGPGQPYSTLIETSRINTALHVFRICYKERDFQLKHKGEKKRILWRSYLDIFETTFNNWLILLTGVLSILRLI